MLLLLYRLCRLGQEFFAQVLVQVIIPCIVNRHILQAVTQHPLQVGVCVPSCCVIVKETADSGIGCQYAFRFREVGNGVENDVILCIQSWVLRIVLYSDGQEREIEVLFMMLRGESFESVGAQLSLSKERIRQVWVKILRKMIVVRNELEYKDLQIAALQKQVLELQEIAENKRFELVPQEIIDNIDLLCKPIETIPFTLRTQRGLAKTRIKTVWDLVQCNRNKIRYGSASIGIKSFQEIEQWLSEHNLKLGLALPPNIDLMQLKQKIDKA